jgi:hypothetical protein
MFEFVVVVTGVVIGLALTHLMQGVAKIIEHPTRVRIWWVDLGWLAYVIANSAFWWWWEFRLRLIGSWTFQLYGFVLAYPLLHLSDLRRALFPNDIAPYQGFRDYFVARRKWFFEMLIAWTAIDVVDTLAKGTAYFASLGIEYPVAQAGLALVSLAKLLSPPRAGRGPAAGCRLSDFADRQTLRRRAIAQTLKLDPQPQPDWALGLSTLNAAPPRSSTKSTAEPRTRSRLIGSTTSFTPPVSATVSSSSAASASSNL